MSESEKLNRECRNFAGLNGDLCRSCNRPQKEHRPLEFEETLAYTQAKEEEERHGET